MLAAISCALFLCYFASVDCKCVDSQLPVYQEEVTEHGYKHQRLFVNKNSPFQINYDIPIQGLQESDLEWHFRDRLLKIDNNPSNEVSHSIKPGTGSSSIVTLNFRAPAARVSGNWTLIVKRPGTEQITDVCFVNSDPIIHRPHGAVRSSEGNPVSITCEIETFPLPDTVTWRQVIFTPDGSAEPRLEPIKDVTYKDFKGVINAFLEFSSSTGRSGFYVCTAGSDSRADNWVVEVRIRDRWSFAYPCIGIVIEILLLATIIGIYEFRQAKRRKAEKSM